jgi:1-acyl-sn-glycerol-3-phosphate acyltransferase
MAWPVVLAILQSILVWGSRVRRLEPKVAVPRTGGLILASNHVSHFDPPLVALNFPRPVDWIAMSELSSTWWSEALFRLVNTIPIRRGAPDRAAMREAAARLAAGRVVGIFPEGGIRDGEASMLSGAPPLRGAALLARMTGAPVIPVAIMGSDRLYNKRRWRPGGRAQVWVAIGEPLPAFSNDDEFAGRLLEAMVTLRGRIIAEGGATEADLPRPPRERMAES